MRVLVRFLLTLLILLIAFAGPATAHHGVSFRARFVAPANYGAESRAPLALGVNGCVGYGCNTNQAFIAPVADPFNPGVIPPVVPTGGCGYRASGFTAPFATYGAVRGFSGYAVQPAPVLGYGRPVIIQQRSQRIFPRGLRLQFRFR